MHAMEISIAVVGTQRLDANFDVAVIKLAFP